MQVHFIISIKFLSNFYQNDKKKAHIMFFFVWKLRDGNNAVNFGLQKKLSVFLIYDL